MHVELTSRCILSCPGCPRTALIDRLGSFPKQDLDLDQFARFVDTDAGRAIARFLLEGNHGDPIYYPHLLEFVDRFRAHKNYVIVTNGARRDAEFWHALASRLTDQDRIIFSIDGLPENNHIYRRNTDWASIEQALQILQTYPVQVTWKTIVFSYNYDQLEQIQALAKSFGADFVSQTTSRFGDESLRPPQHLVEDFREYHTTTPLVTEIQPQCAKHATEYVSADGYYWPCCWVSSAFTLYKSQLWAQRDQWSTKDRTVDQLRNQLANWIDHMQSDPDVVCKMLCKSGNPVFSSHLD
jgi:MoaA/NifB/PqqE/SkfB family radical SAM enzyme